MQNSTEPGYNCTVCGMRHAYTVYVLAHPHERMLHRCKCGAAHELFEGRASFSDPMARRKDGAHLTEWFGPDTPPSLHGYFHLLFPNGTESNRNWWWDGAVFRYDKESPACIALNCIRGWRGLDRYVAH